jgi:hypothetical protein
MNFEEVDVEATLIRAQLEHGFPVQPDSFFTFHHWWQFIVERRAALDNTYRGSLSPPYSPERERVFMTRLAPYLVKKSAP